MTQLVRRACAYQPLSPAERALLRLLEGLGSVALIGAATAAAQYLAGPTGLGGTVNWSVVAHVCTAGAAVAVLMALAKYFKAHGDPTLAAALDALGAHIAAPTAPPNPALPIATAPAPSTEPTAAPDVSPLGRSSGR